MAKAEMKLPDDFLDRLSKLGSRTDTIIAKVLAAGGEIVLSKVKSNLKSVIGKGTKHESRSTGELVDSLGVTSMKVDRSGKYNLKVGFSEPRKKGGSNALIASVIEYGKSGQPPRPFLKPAKSSSKAACISAMKEAMEKELERI